MSELAVAPTDFNPSRRTLVRGAAWSVPANSAAAAVPAFAASPYLTSMTLRWADQMDKTQLGTVTVDGSIKVTVTQMSGTGGSSQD